MALRCPDITIPILGSRSSIAKAVLPVGYARHLKPDVPWQLCGRFCEFDVVLDR